MKYSVKTFLVVATVACMSVGCQGGGLRSREVGALGGAALGAGLGAIIGNQVGHSGGGIAIGSALGGLSGALIGNEFDAQDQARAQTAQRLEEQDRILEENKRLIEELRRRGTDAYTTERGVVINLPDVLFEFDRATLTPDARRTAADVSKVVQSAPGRRIFVEGHTDSEGTVEYNKRLSEQRARAVAGELVAQGVPRRRISTRGFGEERPVASNDSASGRQRNRRVEVVIEN